MTSDLGERIDGKEEEKVDRFDGCWGEVAESLVGGIRFLNGLEMISEESTVDELEEYRKEFEVSLRKGPRRKEVSFEERREGRFWTDLLCDPFNLTDELQRMISQKHPDVLLSSDHQLDSFCYQRFQRLQRLLLTSDPVLLVLS